MAVFMSDLCNVVSDTKGLRVMFIVIVVTRAFLTTALQGRFAGFWCEEGRFQLHDFFARSALKRPIMHRFRFFFLFWKINVCTKKLLILQ